MLFDRVRQGSDSQPFDIRANQNNAQSTDTSGLKTFDTNGFTLNNGGYVNHASNFVAWTWKATNSAGSANSDGSISSTVAANTSSGFSIVKYTGTGSNATIGHGLNTAPKAIFVKKYSTTQSWRCGHVGLAGTSGWDYGNNLNNNSERYDSATYWQDTAPTTSVFSVGTDTEVNGNGATHIAYCFSEVKGMCKIGQYIGNGNSNGPFIHTGFQPAFLLIKKRSGGTASWVITDNRRSNSFNPQDRLLFPDNGDNEDGSGETYHWDFLSNGVKIRTTSNSYGNGSGQAYTYLAYAEFPFVASNGDPVTAR